MIGILGGGGSNNINLDDYYTKEECDDKFVNKTSLDDYYTKEECNAKYLQKAGGKMSGTLNMETDIGDYICFYENNDDSTIGSIGNVNGSLRMYAENGNLVLQSDNDVVLTASGDIRLEDANVSIGTPQNNCDLTVNGECTVNSKLTVNSFVEIDAELIVHGGQSSFDDTVVFYDNIYCEDDIIVGDNGDTVTLNKAFFQSILDRLTALEEKTNSL